MQLDTSKSVISAPLLLDHGILKEKALLSVAAGYTFSLFLTDDNKVKFSLLILSIEL